MDISKHYSGEELVNELKENVGIVNLSKTDMLKVLTQFPMPKSIVKENRDEK